MEDTVCRIILADNVLGMKSRGLGIVVQRVGHVSNIQIKIRIPKGAILPLYIFFQGLVDSCVDGVGQGMPLGSEAGNRIQIAYSGSQAETRYVAGESHGLTSITLL